MALRRLGLRTSIDALHALSAGLTPGAALTLWLLRSGAQATLDPVAFAGLPRTWAGVLLIPFASVTVLVVTGLVRLSHRSADVTPAAIGPRGRATIIKHVVFVGALVASTAWMFLLLQP